MQRRDVLRLLATGTVLQLAPDKLFAVLREARTLVQNPALPRTLNSRQYATVKTMAETILPPTDTPGAADVGAADFIDLMLTEWYEYPERVRFLTGVGDTDSRARNLFARDFVDCSSAQQSEILTDLGTKIAEEPRSPRARSLTGRGAAPGKSFYAMLRQLTVTAYYTSEVGATGVLHFEMPPGSYEGCSEVPSVQEATKQP